MTMIVTLAVVFVVFYILSKWYTLRERNREKYSAGDKAIRNTMRGTWTKRRNTKKNMVIM